MNIHETMKSLADRRPAFHSEADFQFALAREIEGTPEIILEWPTRSILQDRESRTGEHVDIWVREAGNEYFFELKYKTKDLHIEDGRYDLADQSARDCGRYDLLLDLQRLEYLTQRVPGSAGFAVFLTNDAGYWTAPNQDTCDASFRVHQGREFGGKGSLCWAPRTALGTMRGREEPIRLSSTYTVDWREYATVPARNGARNRCFKYLLLKVPGVAGHCVYAATVP